MGAFHEEYLRDAGSNNFMIRVLGTALGALAGLTFGSFLNVCVSRWPRRESIVQPRSHCRGCGRTLRWWENVPLVSWLALIGRCRTCRAWIGWRYPIVELSVAAAWGVSIWRQLPAVYSPDWSRISIFDAVWFGGERMALCWVLIGLAALELERHWLPDWLTLGGAAGGSSDESSALHRPLRLEYRFLCIGPRWADLFRTGPTCSTWWCDGLSPCWPRPW